MSNELNLYYDEEGDFLELNIGDYAEGHFKNLGDGIFERIYKKTNIVSGFAIQSFKKRTQGLKDVKVMLPIKIQLFS